jgi:hypothetical protein
LPRGNLWPSKKQIPRIKDPHDTFTYQIVDQGPQVEPEVHHTHSLPGHPSELVRCTPSVHQGSQINENSQNCHVVFQPRAVNAANIIHTNLSQY